MEWIWIRNKQHMMLGTLVLAIIIGFGTVASARTDLPQGGSSLAAGGDGKMIKCSPIVVPCTPQVRSPLKPPAWKHNGPPPWAGRWNHWRKAKAQAMAKAEAKVKDRAKAKADAKASTGASGTSGAMPKALAKAKAEAAMWLRSR
jgi:hypothetical protein